MVIKFFLLTLLLSANFVHAKRLIFIHGGPGFNSRPEEHLLSEHIKDFDSIFWHEPSQLRMESTYSVESAYQVAYRDLEKLLLTSDDSTMIVAHSFGANYALDLALNHPNRIENLILITPGLDILAADKNILNIAAQGLAFEGKITQSEQLKALIPKLSASFDDLKYQAFVLASEYPSLFFHYWVKTDLMGQYFSYLSGKFAFDPQSFFAVRMSMPLRPVPLDKIKIPTKIYFGELDPVVKQSEQSGILKQYFSQLEIVEIAGTKHYPHIEWPNLIEFK
jgi:pimeloyl-ACP methyl ester carboxylesterase